LAKLDKPSLTPSMRPSHAAATPIEARNADMSVVAISWDKSENRLANPMPSMVRFSQRMPGWLFLRFGVDAVFVRRVHRAGFPATGAGHISALGGKTFGCDDDVIRRPPWPLWEVITYPWHHWRNSAGTDSPSLVVNAPSGSIPATVNTCPLIRPSFLSFARMSTLSPGATSICRGRATSKDSARRKLNPSSRKTRAAEEVDAMAMAECPRPLLQLQARRLQHSESNPFFAQGGTRHRLRTEWP
jgi:hypothetical protein